MRLSLNIDEEALESAMSLSPGKRKAEVINQALRDYARGRLLRGFVKWEAKLRRREDLKESLF
ncbi:MAG: type II toxin-antitoxin system VapB family antitoxin [Acidobacteriota bacterium]